jgi:hypothetical protein
LHIVMIQSLCKLKVVFKEPFRNKEESTCFLVDSSLSLCPKFALLWITKQGI